MQNVIKILVHNPLYNIYQKYVLYKHGKENYESSLLPVIDSLEVMTAKQVWTDGMFGMRALSQNWFSGSRDTMTT